MSSNMEINSDMNIEEGSFIGEKHLVIKFLGAGSYSSVYKCINTETNKMEAIKISQTNRNSLNTAFQEIAILKHLQHLGPDECNIVKYYGFFAHGKHLCRRFELLDQTLKDYMKEKHKLGLPLPKLRPFIQQLATALSHLSSVGIIHADIKPENVMIVHRLQNPLRVKLINFGLSHPVSAADPDILMQDILVKSPEGLLGSPYNEAIDIWSLGLMAAKLATGYNLYTGCTQFEMLKIITETQGQPSDKVLDYGRDTHVFFTRKVNGERRWRFKTPEEFVVQLVSLGSCSSSCSSSGSTDNDESNTELESIEGKLMCDDHQHQRHNNLLVDLIKRMLHLDQDQRIKAQEVLQHPFLTEILPETSETNTHMETVDKRTEDILEFSSDPTAATENIPCRETATVFLAIEQPKTRAQNGGGLLRRIFRRIRPILCCSRTKDS